MHILLTNDDGIEAPGLAALARRAATLGRLTVVAPDRERSGVSHGITLDRNIGCRRLAALGGMQRFALEATPADCVKLAVSELVREPIDLVLSGINAGENVGVSVLYSGTVAAAVEAAMYGLPAAAISLAVEGPLDFARAADIAVGLVEQLLREGALGSAPLNINVPPLKDGWPVGWRVARQSVAAYDDRFEPREGTDAYRVRREESRREVEADTDLALIHRGYVTVTPLSFDLTDGEALSALCRVAEAAKEEA